MTISRHSAAVVALLCGITGTAHAQIYFTGALQYYAASNGGYTDASLYDTFVPATGATTFTVNASTGFFYLLSPGANTFTLGHTGGAGTGYQGLGLFFSNTGTTFTGPFSAAPNLVVFDNTFPSTTFSFPANGIQVANYGAFSGATIYNGATSYQLGGYDVTVTVFDYDFAASSTPTLELFVTAVPEPSASAALAGAAMLGLVVWRRASARAELGSA
ncbi:MAG: hypothetical protein PSW75_05030 [bacterium]|nr:hypothetical protein [bacterium]MDI1337435.1 hypothetical protein [Lacunisphaera sp.]